MSGSLIFTGSHRRRIDRHHQLCLPLSWAQGSPQPWILTPPVLTGAGSYLSGPLCLIPVRSRQLNGQLAVSRRHARNTETAEACLLRLHAQAQRKGLDPTLVTLVQTTPISRRFTLTPAQFGWLGLKQNRTIIFIGSITSVWIYPPSVWEDLVTSRSHAAKKRGFQDKRNRYFDTTDSSRT